jgi:hypothetical protein
MKSPKYPLANIIETSPWRKEEPLMDPEMKDLNGRAK